MIGPIPIGERHRRINGAQIELEAPKVLAVPRQEGGTAVGDHLAAGHRVVMNLDVVVVAAARRRLELAGAALELQQRGDESLLLGGCELGLVFARNHGWLLSTPGRQQSAYQ